MKADSISFKSTFSSNNILKQSFDKAYADSDRYFLKSVKAVLNDGKDDVVELSQRNNSKIDLLINGEMVNEESINYYNNAGVNLIKKLGQKISGEKENQSKYANFLNKMINKNSSWCTLKSFYF